MPAVPAQASEQTLKPRRRYHFHTPGVLYVAVTLFLAVGAINSQNNLLFYALGLSIGGLLVSGILSGASLMGIRLERFPLQRGSVGAPLTLRYAVHNSNRLFPAFGLHIDEVDDADQPARSWSRFFPQPRAFVIHAGPRQLTQTSCQVVPRRRGQIHLDAVRVWTTFPFGLAKKSVTFYLPQTGLVYPPELPLRAGLVARLASRSDQGIGGERDVGSGDEFYGLREYSPGDSPRRIAWKHSARTGDVVVRQYAAPTPQKLWVVLDLAAGAGLSPAATTTSQERAIALASAVLRDASQAGIAIGLAIPATRVLLTLRAGRWHLERLQAQLAMLDVDPEEGPAPGVPASAARSGACVVIHAGPTNEAVGPPNARHLSAAAADQYVEASTPAAALLALLGDPGTSTGQIAGSKPHVADRLKAALGLTPERAA